MTEIDTMFQHYKARELREMRKQPHPLPTPAKVLAHRLGTGHARFTLEIHQHRPIVCSWPDAYNALILCNYSDADAKSMMESALKHYDEGAALWKRLMPNG